MLVSGDQRPTRTRPIVIVRFRVQIAARSLSEALAVALEMGAVLASA